MFLGTGVEIPHDDGFSFSGEFIDVWVYAGEGVFFYIVVDGKRRCGGGEVTYCNKDILQGWVSSSESDPHVPGVLICFYHCDSISELVLNEARYSP